MPIDKLKANIKKQTQEQQQRAEAVYKALIETPDYSSQGIPSTSQTPASDSIIYAELALDPGQYSFQEKVAMDITEYATIFGCSEEESLQRQIAILKDQKKQYLEKLNQAIDENKKNAIDDCRSQLTAIETSMATKINYLEKQNNPESKTETQEVPLAQVDTNLPGPAVDRSVKPGKVDFSKEEQDLVEQRQKIGDKKNLEVAKPRLKSRLEEFSTIWQTPEDKVDLVTIPPSNTEKDTHGPSVDRSRKPGPVVQRELKPSRLAQSSFFSAPNASLSSNVQDEREKEKTQKQAFAHR